MDAGTYQFQTILSTLFFDFHFAGASFSRSPFFPFRHALAITVYFTLRFFFDFLPSSSVFFFPLLFFSSCSYIYSLSLSLWCWCIPIPQQRVSFCFWPSPLHQSPESANLVPFSSRTNPPVFLRTSARPAHCVTKTSSARRVSCLSSVSRPTHSRCSLSLSLDVVTSPLRTCFSIIQQRLFRFVNGQ